ncbi:MAG: PepSY-like domain-containing protein [Chitinophagales bacterium]
MYKCLILFFAVITLSVSAQKITPNKVPGAVGSAFRTKFPQAQQDTWFVADSGNYQVQFFNEKKVQSATFDGKGLWLQTETEINLNQLPAAVNRAFNSQFAGFNVQEVYQVETPKGTTYSFTAFKGKESYDLVFGPKGDLLQKEMFTEEE